MLLVEQTSFLCDALLLEGLLLYEPVGLRLIQAAEPRVDVFKVVWVLCTCLDHTAQDGRLRHEDTVWRTLIFWIVRFQRIDPLVRLERTQPVLNLTRRAFERVCHPDHLECFNLMLLIHRYGREQISCILLLLVHNEQLARLKLLDFFLNGCNLLPLLLLKLRLSSDVLSLIVTPFEVANYRFDPLIEDFFVLFSHLRVFDLKLLVSPLEEAERV